MALSPSRFIDFQGQPATELTLPQGDRVVVLLHGGQPVSWRTADGAEHLYLSPASALDGQTAVRGGVPLCFPQFNTRGPLIKHGFARNLPWQLEAAEPGQLVLGLRSGPVTQAFWAERFYAQLIVELTPGELRLRLRVANTGPSPWSFTAALHSYLQVGDAERVQLDGLDGAARWDAVRDQHLVQDGAPRFGAEFDSVYQAVAQALSLTETGRGTLRIAQSDTCPQTVVWNPGPDLSRKLADLPDDGWRHMLCVEAASIDAPVPLAPGQTWEGWQHLSWRAA
ncbi:MAG: putative glucose-6-phosphate 1-epimerase [Paracidovorax wautersii]|uniref:Putative glucose-6-phosphate 1-epimerase n=1 Tax=Paracidovorax wautersii TaxID=1177982 RepID=A0A7V8FPM2_9BURK|nr:MAG: putative glucose-6-phosphate 1-epimerase [Paracidovorax wautersii]